jgi:hypothetical protein
VSDTLTRTDHPVITVTRLNTVSWCDPRLSTATEAGLQHIAARTGGGYRGCGSNNCGSELCDSTETPCESCW